MNLPDFSNSVPRAVALDLDGTALNSASRLSRRTASAVLALIDAGVPVVIATARPERVISVLTGPEIAARCSLVHMSGAAAVGRAPLSGGAWNPIDADEARLAWDIVSASPISCRMTVELDGRRFAVSHESDADELWTFNTATPDMIVSLEEALAAGPAKVSVNGLGNDLSSIVDALRAGLAHGTAVVPAVDNSFINVHSGRATKSGAMAALIEPTGVRLSEVISFGDDLPDVDLMMNTGWPVAVENAIPEVKAAARFHTASNDDDGVAIVLESLLAAVTDTGA
ncbi:MAG: HAD family hydrolase [Chloroflexi bacterium]|nr:HAD family hydrolase [Chloroflexota bacterium]MDA1296851.1 HAD family hydrolase [Chloroflexota bacterium]